MSRRLSRPSRAPAAVSRVVPINILLPSETREEIGEDDVCVICQMDFNDDDSHHTRGECKHKFHSECYIQWLQSGRNDCPLCRGVHHPHSQKYNTLFSMISRYARKKSTPKPIQNLYERYQKAKVAKQEAKRMLVKFMKKAATKRILAEKRKLRSIVWGKRMQERKLHRELLNLPVIPARVT